MVNPIRAIARNRGISSACRDSSRSSSSSRPRSLSISSTRPDAELSSPGIGGGSAIHGTGWTVAIGRFSPYAGKSELEQAEGVEQLAADRPDDAQPPERQAAARRLQGLHDPAEDVGHSDAHPGEDHHVDQSDQAGDPPGGRRSPASAAVKNQLIGIEAIIARPPQLVVTSAARNVVL